MGTAISRTTAVRGSGAAVARFAALATTAVVLAACGSAATAVRDRGSPAVRAGASAAVTPLSRVVPAPASWPTLSIPGGASIHYPADWRRSSGDPGTATAILTSTNDRLLGYLNLTPREGHETRENWPRFRVEHNAEEGDRAVTMLAAARNLRFPAATGTCVRDSYITTSGAQYTELACLLTSRHASAVVVGASPPAVWAKMSPLIERAIAAFRG